MSNISFAAGRLSSMDAGLLHQIALFSVSGLAMSMMFVAVGGMQFLNPWF